MNLFRPKRLTIAIASVLSIGAIAIAQIERLDLTQMVTRADNAVVGTITSKTYTSVPNPLGLGDLYYTTLTITGESLVDGTAITVAVSYTGADGEGIFDAEAPTADETKIDNRVVAFYKWNENMGGNYAANGLYAAHGGLYPTFTDRRGRTIVQGRGEGYAVPKNILLDDLDARITEIHESLQQNK